MKTQRKTLKLATFYVLVNSSDPGLGEALIWRLAKKTKKSIEESLDFVLLYLINAYQKRFQ